VTRGVVGLLDNPIWYCLRAPRTAFAMPTADRLLERILPRRKFLPATNLIRLPTFHPAEHLSQKLTREHRANEAKVALDVTIYHPSAGRGFNLILAPNVQSMRSRDDRITIGGAERIVSTAPRHLQKPDARKAAYTHSALYVPPRNIPPSNLSFWSDHELSSLHRADPRASATA
jgi:hypothetical protein